MASLLIRNNKLSETTIYKVQFPTLEEAYFCANTLCINPPTYNEVVYNFSRSSHMILEKSHDYTIAIYFSQITKENQNHHLIGKKELVASIEYQNRVNLVNHMKKKAKEATAFEKELNAFVLKNINDLFKYNTVAH